MCYFHCCSPKYSAVVCVVCHHVQLQSACSVVIRHPLPKLSLLLLCRDLNNSRFVNNTSRPERIGQLHCLV